MDITLFKKLADEQLIAVEELEDIERQQQAPISVFWDVSTLLYLGILLATTGLGILVYKNIDTIGHAVIIAATGVVCFACFAICFRNAKGFSPKKVEAPNILFDYVLLLGCLLLVTFVGYIQFVYNVFRNDWGLATFIPMVALFAAAYYFDHLGVLSMGITNLAAWAGFTVAPLRILEDNDFTNERLIFTGILLGASLIAIAFVSVYRGIKAHFAFTYKNFGIHILFISLVAAMVHFSGIYLVWFVLLAFTVVFISNNAVKKRSFYELVVAVLYGYTGFSYVVIRLLLWKDWSEGAFYLAAIYFIASGIGLIRFFIHYNKQLKYNAQIQ